MMRKCNLGGSTRGIALAVTFLLLSLQQCQAQVTVDKESKKYIDAASSVANRIPTIGPYLSILAKTLFVVESDPSYKVMQKEWEGYTRTQIRAERIRDRKLLLEGFQKELEAIESLSTDESRFNKWQFLESLVETDINKFRSTKDEPAAPGLHYYAGAVHLHIDCIDNMLMYLAIGKESARVDEWRRRRSFLTSEYNKALNAEIEKAAAEQRLRFTVKAVQGVKNNSGTDRDGNRTIQYDFVDMYELLDRGRKLGNVYDDRGSVNGRQKYLADGAEKNFNAKFKPLFKIEEGCKLYASPSNRNYAIVPGSEEALSKACGGNVLKVEMRSLPNIEPGETMWGTTVRWDEPPRKFDVQAVITMKYRSDALRLNKQSEKSGPFTAFWAGDALVSFRLVPKPLK